MLALTAVQFVAEGCMGLLSGAAFETFPGFAAFTPDIIGQLLFLSIFASIVAFGIQNVALAHIPPGASVVVPELGIRVRRAVQRVAVR